MTKKILLINDFSGYGKVAISAISPLLVRKRFEVFRLPTMIVSNTLNYGKFAKLDTTEYMKESLAVWEELGFKFDAVSTGYIANDEQAELIADFCSRQAAKGVKIFSDPVMADNGKLYNSITEKRVDMMKRISAVSDYIVPNMTEACFLSGHEYKPEGVSEEELRTIAFALNKLGAKSIVITSAIISSAAVSGANAATPPVKAVAGYDAATGEFFTEKYDEIPVKINGSGDTFSAIMMAELLSGSDLRFAVKKASESVRKLILRNMDIVKEYNGLPIEAGIELL